MSQKLPEITWLAAKDIHAASFIHPLAKPLFELTNSFKYRCNVKQLHANGLGMKTAEIPWAVKSEDKAGIYSGWQALTDAFCPLPERLPVLLFHDLPNKVIETEAICYALQLISRQLHHRHFAGHYFDLANRVAPHDLAALLGGKSDKKPLERVYRHCRMDKKTLERQYRALAQQFQPLNKL
ncbi:hypothetical protein P2G88_06720 [Aliiglaciecola sp. CAU 1673]|uniref:hypothetical protein n=1 Tax=Aliiglaciecola sp. CAU 1673 TaxID=3032595 RepID=UPI0023DADBF5|nr:hypothetical protein [Aliiglaciecola sp. CAU 1673]MDF2177940.1 hypothetical protein [Aliiglaciecola sp. CAU 1673]